MTLADDIAMPQRPLHFWISFAAMVAFGFLNVTFAYLNWVERRDMHNEARMTRVMLNARAIIQMTLVQAQSEGRPLTTAEKEKIDRLWIAAEYDIEQRPVR